LACLHHGGPHQRPRRSHPSAKPPLKLIDPHAKPNVAFFTGDYISPNNHIPVRMHRRPTPRWQAPPNQAPPNKAQQLATQTSTKPSKLQFTASTKSAWHFRWPNRESLLRSLSPTERGRLLALGAVQQRAECASCNVSGPQANRPDTDRRYPSMRWPTKPSLAIFQHSSTRSTTAAVSTPLWAISARNSSRTAILGRRSNPQPD
jgi:hypothetical protein